MGTTTKELEGIVKHLNLTTGNAIAPYTTLNDSKHITNIGNYHLDWAYGGVKLVQMMNDGGGIRAITQGYETKSVCYLQIATYLKGIQDCISDEIKHNKAIDKITKG